MRHQHAHSGHMPHEAALIGAVLRAGHHGRQPYRRPARTDRVQRISGPPRHCVRRIVGWTLAVPAVVVAAMSLAAALSALAVVAALLGRWSAYTDLLNALRASATAVYQLHFTPAQPTDPDCE